MGGPLPSGSMAHSGSIKMLHLAVEEDSGSNRLSVRCRSVSQLCANTVGQDVHVSRGKEGAWTTNCAGALADKQFWSWAENQSIRLLMHRQHRWNWEDLPACYLGVIGCSFRCGHQNRHHSDHPGNPGSDRRDRRIQGRMASSWHHCA